jgi:hypothetical protein
MSEEIESEIAKRRWNDLTDTQRDQIQHIVHKTLSDYKTRQDAVTNTWLPMIFNIDLSLVNEDRPLYVSMVIRIKYEKFAEGDNDVVDRFAINWTNKIETYTNPVEFFDRVSAVAESKEGPGTLISSNILPEYKTPGKVIHADIACGQIWKNKKTDLKWVIGAYTDDGTLFIVRSDVRSPKPADPKYYKVINAKTLLSKYELILKPNEHNKK